MGAFAGAIGIRVADEPPFKDWFNHSDQRMVNNPVAKRRCTDQAALGFGAVETAVRAGLISLLNEFILQLEELDFQVAFKSSDRFLMALPLAGMPEC